MDQNQPTTETRSTQPGVLAADKQQHMHTSGLKNFLTLIIVLLLLLAAPAAYLYRDRTAKSEQANQRAQIDSLQAKVTDLEKKLPATATANNTPTTPSVTEIEAIKASVISKNTAALEGYMAASVTVTKAGTDGPTNGAQTPAQAISDLSYISPGTDPWNFALPPATLTTYEKGFYGQYFPTGALVGKSANNYIVSFSFNTEGKISGIFMSVSVDMLQ